MSNPSCFQSIKGYTCGPTLANNNSYDADSVKPLLRQQAVSTFALTVIVGLALVFAAVTALSLTGKWMSVAGALNNSSLYTGIVSSTVILTTLIGYAINSMVDRRAEAETVD